MKICSECKDVIMYCNCLIEKIEKEEKDLLVQYINYFGDKKPYPPHKVMKEMIKLIKNGMLDKIQNDPKAQAIINKHLLQLKNKLINLK